MIIDSCVWKFFWGGADLRRGTNGGEGGYFMRNLTIKYCCWMGRCGARDLAREFWLQSGLFYKNGGRNIFELGLQFGLFYKNWGRNIFELGLQLACKEERNIFEFGAAIGLQGRGNLVFSPIFFGNFFQ